MTPDVRIHLYKNDPGCPWILSWYKSPLCLSPLLSPRCCHPHHQLFTLLHPACTTGYTKARFACHACHPCLHPVVVVSPDFTSLLSPSPLPSTGYAPIFHPLLSPSAARNHVCNNDKTIQVDLGFYLADLTRLCSQVCFPGQSQLNLHTP